MNQESKEKTAKEKINKEASSRLGFNLETALLKNKKSFYISLYKKKKMGLLTPHLVSAGITPRSQISRAHLHFQRDPLLVLVTGYLSRDPMPLVHLTTSARAIWLQHTSFGSISAVKCHGRELGNVTLGMLWWLPGASQPV